MDRKTYAKVWPVTTTWIEISNEWSNAMNSVYAGQMNVQQAHQQLKPKFDALLDEHQRLIK